MQGVGKGRVERVVWLARAGGWEGAAALVEAMRRRWRGDEGEGYAETMAVQELEGAEVEVGAGWEVVGGEGGVGEGGGGGAEAGDGERRVGESEGDGDTVAENDAGEEVLGATASDGVEKGEAGSGGRAGEEGWDGEVERVVVGWVGGVGGVGGDEGEGGCGGAEDG